jgi:hypothetical protein
MTAFKWLRKPARSPEDRSQAASVLPWLTPDLVDTLASLHEAPPAVANAVTQLLPFGSRAALEDQQLAVEEPTVTVGTGDVERASLALTPLAFEVMALAAERASDETQNEWARRAERAADMSVPFEPLPDAIASSPGVGRQGR